MVFMGSVGIFFTLFSEISFLCILSHLANVDQRSSVFLCARLVLKFLLLFFQIRIPSSLLGSVTQLGDVVGEHVRKLRFTVQECYLLLLVKKC